VATDSTYPISAAAKATEEAERLTKLAGKPPQRAQVKGDYSRKAMSLKVYWSAEVTDANAALDHYGMDASVRLAALDAARKLASALARETKDESKAPPGFRFVKREVPQ
jgi:hypothetical protein